MIRLNRRTVLRLAVSATVLSALGLSATGCGGGGSSGGGGGTPPPNPPPGGGSTTVLQSTINNGASVRTSPINFTNGPLVTDVNATKGDLNFNIANAWQGQGAAQSQVSVGTNHSWFVNGQGSGSTQNFVAR